MGAPQHVVDSFKREEYWWSGELPFPMWGGNTLRTYVYVEDWEHRPTSVQKAILDDVLNRNADFRPTFATALLAHYKKHEWGYRWRDFLHAMLQPVGLGLQPKHMWSLVGTPGVWVPHIESAGWNGVTKFELRFECDWDEEHGLSVEIDDWQIMDFRPQ